MGDYTPSKYQQAIYDWMPRATGNLLIEAKAGSGKTSTLKGMFKLLPPTVRSTMLAFNRSAADELKEAGVPARTLNSAGYSNLMRNGINGVKPIVDVDKTDHIMRTVIPMDEMAIYRGAVGKLVGWAKGCGIVPTPLLADRRLRSITPDSPDTWRRLLDAAEIWSENSKFSEDVAIEYARRVLAASVADIGRIDLDDQKYMTVIYSVPCFQNDWVFVDETQDLNVIDRHLVRQVLKRGRGRLVAVGDRNQAIYGWRGADTSSMDRIKDEFDCAELPLSICYRCPSSVVKMAQKWVPEIEARDNAPEGTIKSLTKYDQKHFQPNDLVICRNNAPLVSLAFKLISAKVPVRIAGRDFGKMLIALLDKLRLGLRDGEDEYEHMEAQLGHWREREIAKAKRKDNHKRIEAIEDIVVTLKHFMDGVDEPTYQSVAESISTLFTDQARDRVVTLSSIHRAKGAEAERVHILEWGLLPSSYAKTAEAMQQEQNLQYVAVTRSKDQLYFIDTDGWAATNAK